MAPVRPGTADLDDARAWCVGILRNTLFNATRGERRRQALAVRVTEPRSLADPAADAVQRIDLARAWSRLSAVHQEALGLAVFEQLTAAQAAAVLAITPVAFRLRLTRARRALRRALDPPPPTPKASGQPRAAGRLPNVPHPLPAAGHPPAVPSDARSTA